MCSACTRMLLRATGESGASPPMKNRKPDVLSGGARKHDMKKCIQKRERIQKNASKKTKKNASRKSYPEERLTRPSRLLRERTVLTLLRRLLLWLGRHRCRGDGEPVLAHFACFRGN